MLLKVEERTLAKYPMEQIVITRYVAHVLASLADDVFILWCCCAVWIQSFVKTDRFLLRLLESLLVSQKKKSQLASSVF